jgi:enamine deaminase RidA (YjgF/YER057c/UK114 family)
MERSEILLGGPNEIPMGLARAVRVGPYVVVGGTAPIAPDGSAIDSNDVTAQAERCYEIIGDALRRAGASPADVVRTRTLLVDIDDQPAVSAVRKRWLGDTMPVDTIVEVSRFVDPAWRLEVEVDAIVPG